jgi:2-oxo-4-hydroxy-4-carboxy-5-ureidoimidazoline decarboxylase
MSTTGLHPSLVEKDRIEIRLAALNDCAPEAARVQFTRCCGSSNWVHRMERARPFAGLNELKDCANHIWASCSREDWLEAFAAHPRIGGASAARWSLQEQSGVAGADFAVLRALEEANQAYEKKVGYTFIIFATGKSAGEILGVLKQRLRNTAEMEMENAAEEQSLIMQLRLRKLLGE